MAGPSNLNAASAAAAQDELTATVFGAVESLSQVRKANFLLETSLALIEGGRCVLLIPSCGQEEPLSAVQPSGRSVVWKEGGRGS